MIDSSFNRCRAALIHDPKKISFVDRIQLPDPILAQRLGHHILQSSIQGRIPDFLTRRHEIFPYPGGSDALYMALLVRSNVIQQVAEIFEQSITGVFRGLRECRPLQDGD